MGKKFTIFALFYFVFEGKFKVQAPPPRGGGLYLEERYNGRFFALRSRGLIFGGACTWRGLFSEFYGKSATKEKIHSENTVMTETPGEMTGSQPITGSDSVYGADCPVGHLHDGVILLLRPATRILQGFAFLCNLGVLLLKPR